MRRLARSSSWRSSEGGTIWDVREPSSSHPKRRTPMDRYIGLDAHASSCTLGVATPKGNRSGLTWWRRMPGV